VTPVPVNIGLAQLSDHFLLVTVFLYALAMLAYAGDFAYGRRASSGGAKAAGTGAQSQATGQAAGQAVDAARVAVSAGVSVAGSTVPPPAASAAAGDATAGSGAVGSAPPGPDGPTSAVADGATPARPMLARALRTDSDRPAGPWVRGALLLTAAGLITHILGIVTRGLSEHRIPWGNMYEFVTAITCAAVIAFLVVALRYRAHSVGLFVMTPVVLGLGLCVTVLYTAAGPLVPALHSYWIAIHVTSAIVATGAFIVSAVLTVIYLVAAKRPGADGTALGALLRHLPSAQALDRLSYRTIVFAFPVWTFAIIAGAIWADEAWGRYWGWDPKETWAFITWVVYAGYLHARATAGWRGRAAAYIQLVGFACLMFNLIGVNIWITGLHSYAGIN
jgi:cytochrome c-type biogenesis protein CcsB